MHKDYVISKLMKIEDDIYSELNISSRPYGDKYNLAVIMMAEQIIKNVPLQDITKEVREALTDSNYHMVNHAIDAVIITDKFSGRAYKNELVSKGNISLVKPIYTGGNIWNLYGSLTDGSYFIASDIDYSVALVNVDPIEAHNASEYGLYCGWEQKHLIRWLDDTEARDFWIEAVNWCKANLPVDDTFICDDDGAEGCLYELNNNLY